MLIKDGIPSKEDIMTVAPGEERLKKGPVAIAECFQNIPCDPCAKACVKKAITIEPDINAAPKVNFDICNGCGACISVCPGLAIFTVDMTYSDNEALVRLPFEFLPVPEQGQLVCGLDRSGKELGYFKAVRVTPGRKENRTYVITLAVPKDLAMEVRNIRPGGYADGQ